MLAPCGRPRPRHNSNTKRRDNAVSSSPSETDYGQNEWLVEEMYQRFQTDPSSVDPSWHELLRSYTPSTANGAAPATAPA
ncbi:MAG: hypothetical protein WAW85_17115, partial [Gordonia sp. (in: high G+C Gram-positive bacteria)]